MRFALAIVVATLTLTAQSPLKHSGATASLPHDPDDPAIWQHPTDPAKSVVLTTDKIEAQGGLYVFGVDGVLRQAITPLDRPNNVDIERGVRLGSRTVDVAIVTERKQRRLRVFAIPADGGRLYDLAPHGLPILAGAAGDAAEPMGVALYRRAGDGAVFVIVTPKGGDTTNYLWQYRLTEERGTLRATLVRRFGHFSRQGALLSHGEIEAVVVDDELGFSYYADEQFGIRKWHADPDHPEAGRELAVLGRDGYNGDREGLAIYLQPGGKGYLLSSDQVTGGSRLHVYSREGGPGGPHDHRLLGIVETDADDTDGIDVTSAALPDFPNGMVVMMNSRGKNFLFYRWEAVLGSLVRPGM